MLIERLFQPTTKDRLTGLNQRSLRDDQFLSAVATTVQTVTLPSPVDTLQHVEGIGMLAVAGAAQFLLYFQVDLRSPQGVTKLRMTHTPNPAPAAASTYGFTFTQLDLMMFVGEDIVMSAIFNAAVAANSLRSSLWGYRIPRGNIEGP